MTNPEFVKWLAGFFALSADDTLTRKQLYIISNHLNLAEAIEGALGPFNAEIRQEVAEQIDLLEGPEHKANPDFIRALKQKVLTRANEI